MNWIMGRLGPLKTGSQGLEKCFGKRAPACLDAAWVYVCYTSPLVEFLGKKHGNTWEVLGRLLSRYFRKLRTETKTRFIGGFLVRGHVPYLISFIVRRLRCTDFCAQQYGRRSLRSPGCPENCVAFNGHSSSSGPHFYPMGPHLPGLVMK